MLRPIPKALWPRSYPLYALVGLMLGLALGGVAFWYQAASLQPLQKFYLPTYFRTQVVPFKQNFQMVEAYSVRGPRVTVVMAVDPWVRIEGTGKQRRFYGTREGLAAGINSPYLAWLRKADPDKVQAFLVANIYHGTLTHLFLYSLWIAGIASLLGLLGGLVLDQWAERRAHEGVQVRGPILRSPKEAARKTRGDGVALWLETEAK